MNRQSKSIAILSLGQVLAVARAEIKNPKEFEILERHIRQVAAIVLERPWAKVDGQTDSLMAKVERLLGQETGEMEVETVKEAV